MATGKRKSEVVRVAAMADLHYGKTSGGSLVTLFEEISEAADVLVVAGDLTDHGLAEEAHLLAKDLAAGARLPIIGVLGNHDFESGNQDELSAVFSEAGIEMLDGGTCEVKGLGFAGVKGFAGGFDKFMLAPWGEGMIKAFVREALNEALKLETALARLTTEQCLAVLHYAPIRSTVEGEPPEIVPFIGSSRLEEPLNRRGVFAVFHGHAHHGSPEGRTASDIPVYNVSTFVLKRVYPERSPFCLVEVPIEEH